MPKVTPHIEVSPVPVWEELETFVRGKIQTMLQSILDEELTCLLGRQKSQKRVSVDARPGYRNGYGKPRRLSMQCGTVVVQRPRVRDLGERFVSRVLPLFMRQTKEVGELLPELYLHGLSLGDFELALRGLLGEAAPLSASSIDRLRGRWIVEHQKWKSQRLDDFEIVYVWADGVYVKAGLEREKAALLVVIGALSDGSKVILAVEPGYRESKESWASVLRDLRDRGLKDPKLAVADGIAGFWTAAAETWPLAKEQRCWNHKIVNVLDQLPKKVQSEARELLCAIPYAPTRREAEELRDDFVRHFETQYPKAASILTNDWQRMVAFYDFPVQHWKHLRTTNVIESPFATVRLRTGAAKRYKKVANATVLIWKIMMVAETRFRRLSGPELLPLVYAGAVFQDGQQIQRNQERKLAA